MSNYGFNTSDEVQFDKKGFPVGTFGVMAVEEENVPSGVAVTYEILDGELKGTRTKIWHNTLSDNPITAKIAKQDLKRIGDACGNAISAATPIKGRVFGVEVTCKEDSDFTNVKRFFKYDAPIQSNPF